MHEGTVHWVSCVSLDRMDTTLVCCGSRVGWDGMCLCPEFETDTLQAAAILSAEGREVGCLWCLVYEETEPAD